MRSLLAATLALGVLCSSFGPVAANAAGVGGSDADARLLSAVRLWGDVKYFDPQVAYRDLDWDAALLQAVPAVETASTPQAYRSAIAEMLQPLNDPLTHVVTSEAPLPTRGQLVHVAAIPGIPGAMQIGFDWANAANATQGLSSSLAMLHGARIVVVDLRFPSRETGRQAEIVDSLLQETALGPALFNGDVALPSQRTRAYAGFAPAMQGIPSDGDYVAKFVENVESVLQGKAAAPVRVAFLTGPNAYVPDLALAMIRKGDATIFAAGDAPTIAGGDTDILALADGIEAQFRVGEYARVASDAPVSQLLPASSDPIAEAAARLRDRAPAPVALPPPPPGLRTYDNPYETPAFPDEPHRILAVARMYNVVRYFSPYYSLMHDDWDAATLQAFAEVRAATTSTQYLRAVERYYAHLHDSHGFIGGALPSSLFGAGVPWETRLLHGKAVVAVVADAAAAAKAGVRVGDEIVAVDGVPVARAIASHWQYVDASTTQARYRDVLGNYGGGIFAGAFGAPIRVTLRHLGSKGTFETTLARMARSITAQRTGPIVTILPGNVGYVDLDRLQIASVDSMFRKLAGTRAIVFDDRGYPHGTAWSIAPRLTRSSRPIAARFDRPEVDGPRDVEDGEIVTPRNFTAFYQRIPAANGSRYLKPTVLLVDERTQSQAEHTVLFFQAAARTRVVGSSTAGADGDVTSFTVPGGIVLMFSGQSVRHADGRQLQRIGLIPDVRVEPTARDLAAGNDPVLLAGLADALRTSHASAHDVRHAVALERKRERTAFAAENVALRKTLLAAATDAAYVGRSLPGAGATTALPDQWTVSDASAYARAPIAPKGPAGGAAMGITATRAATIATFGSLGEYIDASPYRGKKLHVFGYLRTDRVNSAGVWVRVDGSNGAVLAFDNMEDRQLQGTRGWTPFSVVLPVPASATRIALGLLLMGSGTLYGSDLRIETVPDATPSTAAAYQ